ncbi:MAG: ABC transporter ATP-binding protein [Oscillospiraceae bacterium]|jgi:simple sugar transport system ATP-binding protein|nr:ABC transporter ATP-binding protein [Oscillospiraceae bacterium]
MVGIQKSFGRHHVLKNIDFSVEKGTIHALLGENGAGKSTLMNILYGLHKQDSGDIFINGELVEIKSPKVAIEHKIGMVHQHFMLVPTFTVAQNIMLGSELTKGLGIVDFKKANREISRLSEEYGQTVNTKKKIEDMAVGMQQRVEILKALYRGAETLILDEPTAVLTPQEIKKFIENMRNLARSGKTIIMITHKLNEVKQMCDYCTVIRRGENVVTVHVDDYSEQQLASMMVGKELTFGIEKKPANPKEIKLEVQNLLVSDDRGVKRVDGVSFEVRAGEILGIAGVDENGQQELVEAITCLRKVTSGRIKINGKEIQNTSIANVIKSGIATIPEDRQKSGLVMTFSVAENILLKGYKGRPFSKYGRMNKSEINKFASRLTQKFDVRPKDCAELPVKKLSGGNQQKVVIARETSTDPDLLIAIQPTRGLDVGAIGYVHKILIEQRDKGKAVLLISLELDEIMDVADRIAVIYNGKIAAIVDAAKTSEAEIGMLMTGGGKK